jgi:hypothetical protein
MTSALPFDWVAKAADNNGLARMAAWANDGVNDICPAGFSVPTEGELAADTTIDDDPSSHLTQQS